MSGLNRNPRLSDTNNAGGTVTESSSTHSEIGLEKRNSIKTTKRMPELLTELCLRCIVTNFHLCPHLFSSSEVPKKFKEKVINLLPVSLPLEISAPNLRGQESESYWKRCCLENWKNTDISLHGSSWKRAFFEQKIGQILRDCRSVDPDRLKKILEISHEYVFSLEATRLPDPIDIHLVLMYLTNVTELHFSYTVGNAALQKTSLSSMNSSGSGNSSGRNNNSSNHNGNKNGNSGNINNNFTSLSLNSKRSIQHAPSNAPPPFAPPLPANISVGIDNISLNEIMNLTWSIRVAKCLTILDLSHNVLTDEHIRVLAKGFIENVTLTHLDLSHNAISDKGAKAISKFLINPNCVLIKLNLTNNQIRSQGAVYIANSLKGFLSDSDLKNAVRSSANTLDPNRSNKVSSSIQLMSTPNTPLEELSLRLNRIEDDGGKALFEALKSNSYLSHINLAGNALGIESCRQLSELIWMKKPHFTHVDISSNPLGRHCGEVLIEALEWNTFVLLLDVRQCDLPKNFEDAVSSWMKRNSSSKSENKLLATNQQQQQHHHHIEHST